MLKRELIRIFVAAIVGLFIGFLVLVEEDSVAATILLFPFYAIGIFYAGKTLIKMLGAVLKCYFQYQILSFFHRPVVGSILCILLLGLGISFVVSVGWIVGIGKCIYSIVTAIRTDRELGFYI